MSLRKAAIAFLILAACTPAPTVTFEDVQQRYELATRAYESEMAAFERTAARDQPYTGNLAPLADFLRASMRQRRDAAARERAGVYLAMLPAYRVPLTDHDYAEISEAVPPTSAHWAAMPQSIRYAAEGLEAGEARTLLTEIAAQNTDRTAQAWALVYLAQLERHEGRGEAFEAARARLSQYRDIEGLRFAAKLLDPDNRVAIGRPAPAFALPEVGTNRIFTSESLRGRYYLIDFWATWCGPCLTERAALTRAQRRFGGDRFTIVSVSLDNNQDLVSEFRARRWSMDWPNLFMGGQYEGENINFDTEAAAAFDINWIGVPQLILVSPEGEVLALRDRLEGPLLERTLAAYLGEPS